MSTAEQRIVRARELVDNIVGSTAALTELARGHADNVDWYATDVRDGARAILQQMEAEARTPCAGRAAT